MTESQPIGESTFLNIEERSRQRLNSFLDIPVIKSVVVRHLPKLLDDPKSADAQFNGGILYLAGLATRHMPDDEDVRNKSLPLRAARADAFKRAMNIRKNPLESMLRMSQISTGLPKPPDVSESARNETTRKKLTEQFYRHTRVDVHTEKYGIIGGEVAVLNPDAPGIPIIFIPGSSNDPESVESAAVSLALQTKRKVIVTGYPDGPDGLITKAFSQAVIAETKRAQRDFSRHPDTSSPPGLAPYVEFFNALIHEIQKDDEFELWGFSSGGPIIAKLLSQPEFQNRVTNAVIFNPAGAKTFSVGGPSLPYLENRFKGVETVMTYIRELPFLTGFALSTPFSELLKGRNPFLYAWREDPRDPKISPEKFNKVEAWKHLGVASHYRIPEWETARVKDGGSILVYAQKGDRTTRAYETFNSKSKPDNPQIRVINQPGGNHETILTNPDIVLMLVLEYQRKHAKSASQE